MENGTKIEGIRYTMRADHPIVAIRGLTLEGGIPQKAIVGGTTIDVVAFETRVEGKQVQASVATNPGLAEAVAEYHARVEAARKAEAAALEAAVPGLAEIRMLSDLVGADAARYEREMDAMMEDENNDGVRPPKAIAENVAEKLRGLLAGNERAALYIRAKRQDEGVSWADNTGAGAAGRKAMEILAGGGTIEEAKAALAVRREFVD